MPTDGHTFLRVEGEAAVPLAYRGKEGCESVICTRVYPDNGWCYGWHCARCDEPCSYQGHDCADSTTGDQDERGNE